MQKVYEFNDAVSETADESQCRVNLISVDIDPIW
jgi:hypothetical protein